MTCVCGAHMHKVIDGVPSMRCRGYGCVMENSFYRCPEGHCFDHPGGYEVNERYASRMKEQEDYTNKI